MIHHHPDDNLLTEYAAGTLDTAQAIAITAHLHFCTQCKHKIMLMEQTGGAMLETLSPEPIAPDSFDSLMSMIEKGENNRRSTPRKAGDLPNVVSKMMDHQSLKWRKVNSSLKTANLVAGQKQHAVSLQKINAGGVVPEHDHRGVEITVVLKGSFSDKNGIYQAGDFVLKEPGDVHQPLSASNEDCLCLSVESAPVKLTGLFSRLLNPFIKLRVA